MFTTINRTTGHHFMYLHEPWERVRSLSWFAQNFAGNVIGQMEYDEFETGVYAPVCLHYRDHVLILDSVSDVHQHAIARIVPRKPCYA